MIQPLSIRKSIHPIAKTGWNHSDGKIHAWPLMMSDTRTMCSGSQSQWPLLVLQLLPTGDHCFADIVSNGKRALDATRL